MRIEMSKEEWLSIYDAAYRGIHDTGDGRHMSDVEEAANGDKEALEYISAVDKLRHRLGVSA